MTHATHPDLADPVALTALGQRMILDTLRAEMASLQVILPGVSTSQPPAQDADESPDAFDNMPV